jgi:hypothetical protein
MELTVFNACWQQTARKCDVDGQKNARPSCAVTGEL